MTWQEEGEAGQATGKEEKREDHMAIQGQWLCIVKPDQAEVSSDLNQPSRPPLTQSAGV